MAIPHPDPVAEETSWVLLLRGDCLHSDPGLSRSAPSWRKAASPPRTSSLISRIFLGQSRLNFPKPLEMQFALCESSQKRSSKYLLLISQLPNGSFLLNRTAVNLAVPLTSLSRLPSTFCPSHSCSSDLSRMTGQDPPGLHSSSLPELPTLVWWPCLCLSHAK